MSNETRVISNLKEQKLIIEREFEGPVDIVWRAWTEPELVKKWWGPQGFFAPSIKIDFRVGGKYTFCMHGTAGSRMDQDMYTSGVYREIVKHTKISVTEYLSDQNGDKIEMPGFGGPDGPFELKYTLSFENLGKDRSKLSLEYDSPGSIGQFEAMLNSGMEKGWSQAFVKLAEAIK